MSEEVSKISNEILRKSWDLVSIEVFKIEDTIYFDEKPSRDRFKEQRELNEQVQKNLKELKELIKTELSIGYYEIDSSKCK